PKRPKAACRTLACTCSSRTTLLTPWSSDGSLVRSSPPATPTRTEGAMLTHYRLTMLVFAAGGPLTLPPGGLGGLNLGHAPPQSMPPGGGGIVGTGGLSESSIQCVHCHIKPALKIDAIVTPVPAFGPGTSYVPGQKYQLTVKMTGEHLGMSNCPTGGMN